MKLRDRHIKAVGICRKYPKNQIEDMPESEFDFVWQYIQDCNATHNLRLLELVMPLGILKYRLSQKIRLLESKE